MNTTAHTQKAGGSTMGIPRFETMLDAIERRMLRWWRRIGPLPSDGAGHVLAGTPRQERALAAWWQLYLARESICGRYLAAFEALPDVWERNYPDRLRWYMAQQRPFHGIWRII